MGKEEMDPLRRRFLIDIVSAGVGLAGLSFFVRIAGAMGSSGIKQGVRKIEGDIRINGKPATPGSVINIGDRVSTGVISAATFVVGEDAFLLRADSEVVIEGKPATGNNMQVVELLRLSHGKLLSVFGKGKGKRKIMTPTAVAGVRGTGIYVEVEPERTYICTCYGQVDIEALGRPCEKEKVETQHHDAPRYIHASGNGPLIVKAPVQNHTDAELITLESYVNRRPPFEPSDDRY